MDAPPSEGYQRDGFVVGDDDGIAVVPLARQAELLAASKAKLADEEATMARIKEGEMTADRLGIPEPTVIG